MSAKGSERKNHKYLTRHFKNGKWFYTYAKDKAGDVKKKLGYAYGSEYKKDAEKHGEHYGKLMNDLIDTDNYSLDKVKGLMKVDMDQFTGADKNRDYNSERKQLNRDLDRATEHMDKKMVETERVGRKAINADYKYKHSAAYKVDQAKEKVKKAFKHDDFTTVTERGEEILSHFFREE